MRLTRRWILAAALGLLGTALLCVAEATHATDGTGRTSMAGTLLGIGLGLVAAATYALYSWAAHRLITRQIPSRAAMGAVFGLGGLLLVPVLLATGAPLLASWSNASVGAYMALVPMLAGYVLFGWGLAHVPASTATTLSLLEPAVAAVLAVLVVGELLPAAALDGHRPRHRLPRRPHHPHTHPPPTRTGAEQLCGPRQQPSREGSRRCTSHLW